MDTDRGAGLTSPNDPRGRLHSTASGAKPNFTPQTPMGNLKKKRRLKMNKHKRRKRLKAMRHKKRNR